MGHCGGQNLPQASPWGGGFPPCAALRCRSAVTPCPSAVTPCPARLCLVATAAATWDNHRAWEPKTLPSPAPPVPHAGCIFRSLSALVKTEGISPARFAFPVCLGFHWNGVKRRRVHAGSGTDQQVSWECLSGSQRCSLPSPWLSFEVCSSSAFLLLLPPSPRSPYHTSSAQTFPGHFT